MPDMLRSRSEIPFVSHLFTRACNEHEWATELTTARVLTPSIEVSSKIESFLGECADSYPSIDHWWKTRVRSRLALGERTCRIAMVHGQIVAVAIGKINGRSAKLCTLRVAPQYRGRGLAGHLLDMTVRDFHTHGANRVHFTISEPVLTLCEEFFATRGFSRVGWSSGRYRQGVDEFVMAASVTRRRLEGRVKRPCAR